MRLFKSSPWLALTLICTRGVTTVADELPCGNLICRHAVVCVQDVADFESHRLPDGSLLDIHKEESQVHCTCQPGWTGVACDVPFHACDDSKHKCYHGGKCVLGLLDMYDNEQLYCNCDDATDDQGNRFVGKYCEQKSMTMCNPNDSTRFCLNDGICNEAYPLQDQGKSCICDEGYKGPHCEYKKDSVPDCELDCQNGGHCILGTPPADGLDDYAGFWDIVGKADELKQYCRCEPGFYGQYCEIESVPCGENRCFHGAKCIETEVNGETLHNCDCRFSNEGDESYAGRFCQYEANMYCDKGTGNEINGHLFCVNGGTCRDNPKLGCKCPVGYRGFSCEYYVAEDLPADHVSNNTAPFDPIEHTNCTLDCNGRGECRDGAKDIDPEVVGSAGHLSNATAVASENFEHCVCQHGWTGLQCEHKVEECAAGHYCFHGGECHTGGTEQKCDCSMANSTELGTSTFGGDQCQHPATEICTKQEDTLTYNPSKGLSFCVNHGTCKAKVEEGEPHPGCNCDPEKWTGPHCEVPVTNSPVPPPVEIKDPEPSNDEKNDDDDKRSAFEVAMIIVVVLVILPFGTWSAVSFYRDYANRHKPQNPHVQRLRESSQRGYRDRPLAAEQNLSPRRSSTVEEDIVDDDNEMTRLAPTSSSRDPFAGQLVITPPPPLNDAFAENASRDGPQVYLGPPKDEDGNVLHSVEIV